MAVTAEQPGWEKLEIEDYRNSFGFGFRELVMTKEGPPVEFTIRLLEGASLDVILTRSGLSVVSVRDIDSTADPTLAKAVSGSVKKTFESLESLLQEVSPKFRESFAGELAGKLLKLAEASDEEGEGGE